MSDVNKDTIADIVAWLRRQIEGENAYLTLWREEIADRLEAAHKREDAMWRAAFAKIEEVVTIQYAKRNLGEQARRAVAEIMSACRFPDGALDEYERAFEENARLRALVK